MHKEKKWGVIFKVESYEQPQWDYLSAPKYVQILYFYY